MLGRHKLDVVGVPLDVVVDEGTERQDRLTLGARRLERLTDELRTEPLPLEPRLDLRMDERDDAGTAPKHGESRELLTNVHLKAVLGFVVGDGDGGVTQGLSRRPLAPLYKPPRSGRRRRALAAVACDCSPSGQQSIDCSAILRRITPSVVLKLRDDLIKPPERRTPLDP